jgi:bisphosphoglycerate-independent phosphoglycerate mutase (AlkP superfamily)
MKKTLIVGLLLGLVLNLSISAQVNTEALDSTISGIEAYIKEMNEKIKSLNSDNRQNALDRANDYFSTNRNDLQGRIDTEYQRLVDESKKRTLSSYDFMLISKLNYQLNDLSHQIAVFRTKYPKKPE